MALFHTNICSFDNCGLLFATLTDLVQHIEETHISEDNNRIEQGIIPQCVPLSAICRVFPMLPETKAKAIDPDTVKMEGLKKRASNSSASSTPNHIQQQIMRSLHQRPHVMGSEDNGLHMADTRYDSNQLDDTSSSSFMHLVDMTSSSERKYACPISGCKKKYKNLHGVRYHAKVAHEQQQSHTPPHYTISRPHRCHCGKAYKTRTGLENHTQNTHRGRHSKSNLPAPVPPVAASRQSIPVTLISGMGVSQKPTTIQVTPSPSAHMPQGRSSAAQQQLQQALAATQTYTMHNQPGQARTRFTLPRHNQGGITIRPSGVTSSSNSSLILQSLPPSNTTK